MGGRRRLAVSGKMASGKDAVAVAAVERTGLRWRRVNIADAIRQEAQRLYDLAGDPAATADLLAAYDPDGRHPELVARIAELTLAGGEAGSRTAANRVVLQQLALLGRLTDPTMWLRRHLRAVADVHRDDPDVVVVTTDVREVDEVRALADDGFVVVRLDVSADVQRRRLLHRDGLIADDTVNHPNETALDAPDPDVAALFALRLSNDGPLDTTVEQVAELLAGRWGR